MPTVKTIVVELKMRVDRHFYDTFFLMMTRSVERRLRHVADQILILRKELYYLDEELRYLLEEADTARLQALLSETPIAERSHRQASRHAQVVGKRKIGVERLLLDLDARQNILLDRISE